MPGKTLGIDIDQERITAVQVASGMKGYEITACLSVIMDEENGPGKAIERLLESADLKSDICNISISPSLASFRNLKMPFKESKKIKQALPYEIETIVPFPVDDIIIDFIVPVHTDRSEILAVSIKKSDISQHLSILRACGIEPDIIEIKPVPAVSWLLDQDNIPENFMFLDFGQKNCCMVLINNSNITLIRSFIFDKSIYNDATSNDTLHSDDIRSGKHELSMGSLLNRIQNTIHSYSWSEKRIINPEKLFYSANKTPIADFDKYIEKFFNISAEQIHLDKDKRILINKTSFRTWDPSLMNNALALAVRDSKKERGFNFRKDEFEIKKSYFGYIGEIRKAAVFLILILFFLSFDLGIDSYFLKQRYDEATRKSEEIFRQAFPEVSNVNFPVHQMKQKISEIEKSTFILPGNVGSNHKVIEILKDISERIPESFEIDISTMVIDPDTVRITGETDTYDTVYNMKNNLEPSGYFDSVDISSASNPSRSGGRINFEIKIKRAR